MWEHRCECCGCSLDPGEGRICEECLEEREREAERKRILSCPEARKKETVPVYG